MWFEKLTGFSEESPQQVRSNLTIDGSLMRSQINREVFVWGTLETPSLGELRKRVHSSNFHKANLSVQEIVADVQSLHADSVNAQALFQVASQFNLLEMVSPGVTPEQGVGIYELDHTQGPACAIAAGAGTIYRNYFAPVNGQIGQSSTNQINCLADLGTALGNSDEQLWVMRNGYALPSEQGLVIISKLLKECNEHELDEFRKLLRIGIQWNTQVTLNDTQHTVSQVYCSALPVAYTPYGSVLWERFARLVLEAAYEATICTAILNSFQNGNNALFLTLLGGGAFGNEIGWILDAIQRALHLYQQAGLEINIVSYGTSKPFIQRLVSQH